MKINNPLPVQALTFQISGITATVIAQLTPGATVTPQSDVAVMSGAAVQIVAANAARQTVLISNTSTTGNVRLGDAGVTASKGVRLAAGAVAALDTKGAVSAISETALTNTLAVTELGTP